MTRAALVAAWGPPLVVCPMCRRGGAPMRLGRLLRSGLAGPWVVVHDRIKADGLLVAYAVCVLERGAACDDGSA